MLVDSFLHPPLEDLPRFVGWSTGVLYISNVGFLNSYIF